MGWIVGSFTGEALVQPSMAVSERLVGQEGRDEAIERAGRATADPVPVGVGITSPTTDQPADGRGQFLEDAVLVHLQGEDDVQSDVGGTDRAAVLPDQGLDLRVAGDVLEVQDEGVAVPIGDRDEDRAVGGGDVVAAVVVDLDGTVLGGVLEATVGEAAEGCQEVVTEWGHVSGSHRSGFRVEVHAKGLTGRGDGPGQPESLAIPYIQLI